MKAPEEAKAANDAWSLMRLRRPAFMRSPS